MPTEKKKEIIDKLQQMFADNDAGIMADYRGINTPSLVDLRHKLRDAGIENFHVVKNSLAGIAATNAGKKQVGDTLVGPLAIVFVKDDITQPAKVITEHIASTKLAMTIQGGFMGDKVLSAKDIAYLATLPSREVLIAKALGGIQGPLYGLLNQVAAPLRGLAYVLQGRINQLEETN